MKDYVQMIQDTFRKGSVRDAEELFAEFLKNAFPTFVFRRVELIRFSSEPAYMEGRSWNHVFEIQETVQSGCPVWKVECRRVTMGRTPDKKVLLDHDTLGFLRYTND